MKSGSILASVFLLLIPTIFAVRLRSKNGKIYECQKARAINEKWRAKMYEGVMIIKGKNDTPVAMKFGTIEDPLELTEYIPSKDDLLREKALYDKMQDHLGIAKCYDYIEDQGEFVLALELMGEDLDVLRRRQPNGTFSIKTTLMIGLQVLPIIEHMHQHSIHFRFLPSNIFAIDKHDACRICLRDLETVVELKNQTRNGESKRIYADDVELMADMLFELLNGFRPSNELKPNVGGKCPKVFADLYTIVYTVFRVFPHPSYWNLMSLFEHGLYLNDYENDGVFDWNS